MITKNPKITFSICNCNRLYYLKSCVESLIFCTSDFSDKEIIVIDNASCENGTDEYLSLLKDRGIKVIKKEKRDYNNEFAQFLNITFEEAKGDFIAPLQGDMQFILFGGEWLKEYINFYEKNINNVGCITFDAQRNITNFNHKFSELVNNDCNFKFLFDYNRPPISGAGDVLYSRKVLEKIYPWKVDNISHEYSGDSETAMLTKIRKMSMHDNFIKNLRCAVPIIPPSATIFNSKGSNARVRKNKRYGEYFAPKEWKYYNLKRFKDFKYIYSKIPFGFENIVEPINFNLLFDEKQNLAKIPIRPEKATPDQYETLYEEKNENIIEAKDNFLKEWLN